jgi:hypothetical protein
MSISAIPVIAKVLMEMNIIRRDIGQVTLAAGMIDDTVGWILLSVVAGMASGTGGTLTTAGKSLIAVIGVLLFSFTIGRRAVPALIRFVDNRFDGPMVKLTLLMVLALCFGALTHALQLEAVLGAFIVGILGRRGQAVRPPDTTRFRADHARRVRADLLRHGRPAGRPRRPVDMEGLRRSHRVADRSPAVGSRRDTVERSSPWPSPASSSGPTWVPASAASATGKRYRSAQG